MGFDNEIMKVVVNMKISKTTFPVRSNRELYYSFSITASRKYVGEEW